MGQADQLADHLDLDHRGHVRDVWNHHSPSATTIFPWLLSLRGYGLLVANPNRAAWDLGHSDPASFAYTARGGGLQHYFFSDQSFSAFAREFRTNGLSTATATLNLWIAAVALWISQPAGLGDRCRDL
jgi:alpha-glucosidase